MPKPIKVKIEILQKTNAECRRVRPGDIIEVSEHESNMLISMGKAKLFKQEYKPQVSNPLVSIIIPTHNDSEYLSTCLNSILNQTYKNLEIIVVDDGSDKEPEISHPVSTFLSLSPQSGASTARNIGAEQSNGEYLFFCDVDVVLHPEIIEKMFYAINSKYPAWAYCNFKIGKEKHIYAPFSLVELKTHNLCSTMSLIKKKDFPGFDPELIRFQDWDLFLNMAMKGKRGMLLNEFLFTASDRMGITKGTISNSEAKGIIKNKWSIK